MDASDRESARPDRGGLAGVLLRLVGALIGLGLLAGLGYGVLAGGGRGQGGGRQQTATVRRRDLIVCVVEGGALHALEYLEVRNEAQAPIDPATEHRRTILEIVDEGTLITQQDVEDGMVLARMESCDLEEREARTQVWLYGREAAHEQARENCRIQSKQNESDVARAELSARVARMECERYLGSDLAEEVIQGNVSFADLAEDPRLGGVARQRLREHVAGVELATEELSQGEERLGWTKQLHEKGWVRQAELTADQHRVNRHRRELEAAREELRLFRRYTVPKEARQRHSDYMEGMRHLARTEARARSRLAQAEAEVKSTGASYELERERLAEIRESIEECVIRAPKAGRVVYASTVDAWRRMEQPVQEGQTLWPKQSVILIPDLSSLAARVRIHESDIEKIELGQAAAVSVEAMPDRQFTGKVVRVGSVASQGQAYINPEVRVYEVDVALDEDCEGLTPGMTATAEIVVARRRAVLCIPGEAVAVREGQAVCTVAGSGGPELRRIEPGHFTGRFVEVVEGLAEGEVVYLNPSLEPPAARRGRSGTEPIPTFTVERGDFTVRVAERGAVYSMEPLELKSALEGWNSLLEIVDEGTLITQRDVEEGLVLAKLDPAPLEEQESNRQISLYEAEAAHVQAREGCVIQQKQNESDLALAALNAEFARMELDRYLGAELAAQVMDGSVEPGDLPDGPRLGGVARQQLRAYESQVELAIEGLLRAEEALRWSRELHEKGYASRNELRDDELAVLKRKSELESAQGQLGLLKRYTLPRQVEQRYSDCAESARELRRVEARAASRLAQAKAELKSCEAAHRLEGERLDKVRTKIEKCTIRAPQPGRVIYGSRSDPIWYRTGMLALRPGTWVEEGRTIIRIPDTSTLAVVLHVPEADIQKVRAGQPARIALEAAPGRVLEGRVARVSGVAAAEETWLNPEGKVYEVDVAFERAPGVFIPGMSATVEIIAAQLKDVLYVPAQAVIRDRDHAICWVKGATGPVPRAVEVGHLSDVYAEITRGLNPGEQVYLAPPRELPEWLLADSQDAGSN